MKKSINIAFEAKGLTHINQFVYDNNLT